MIGIKRLWSKLPYWCQGLLCGWVVGMLWWVGLMIASGPSTVIETSPGVGLTVRHESVASRFIYAPLVAIPWAIVGFLIGIPMEHYRGHWITACSCIGAVIGGAYIVATHPFDGWLGIMMTGGCLGGALVGFVVGIVVSAALGWTRDDE